MSFMQLTFLLGVVAVAGPIIAHLLSRPRYRRLPFTMLRFLQAGQKESQSRRNLRDILILLLRCSIIILIAILFARPRLRVKINPEQTRSWHCLALDNSISMTYSDGLGTYFDRLIDTAVERIRAANDNSVFNIYPLASGRWRTGISKEQALVYVRNLRPVPDTTDIDGFLWALNANLSEVPKSDTISVFVLSDFTPKTLQQFNQVTTQAVVNEIDCRLIVSNQALNNAAIISARVDTIIKNILTLKVTIVNYGQTEQNRFLTAQIGEIKSPSVDVVLGENEHKVYRVKINLADLSIQDSFLPVELSLSAGDGLQADDMFYLAIQVPQQKNVNVLLAEDKPDRMFLLKTAIKTLSRMKTNYTIDLKHVPIVQLGSSDLKWADVVFCSGITEELGTLAEDITDFIRAGGKIVFFLTEEFTSQAANQLWHKDILAALPTKCVRGPVYIQPGPIEDKLLDMNNASTEFFSNYNFGRILLTGYLELQPHSDSNCDWKLQNGTGFIYSKALGEGTSVLINTSTDDSLGSLSKSNASLAFYSYLLGRNDQIQEYQFSRGEPVILPAYNMQDKSVENRQVWIQTCDSRKHCLVVTQNSLFVPEPNGTGWVKTFSEPIRYAGINLPQNETDMAVPTSEELNRVIERTFLREVTGQMVTAETLAFKKYKPYWKIIVWIVIILLLIEPAITNRLER